MKRRLVIILVVLVLLPLALLAGLGVNLARGERQRLERRVGQLFEAQLRAVAGEVERFVQTGERRLDEFIRSGPLEIEALRERARGEPWVRQVFIIEPDGTLSYPTPLMEPSTAESEFFDRTREIWRRGDLQPGATAAQDPPTNREPQAPAAAAAPPSESEPPEMPGLVPQTAQPQRRLQKAAMKGWMRGTPQGARSGWYPWYWGNGLNLIYWRERGDGGRIGVEIERARMLADLIGALPATDPREPAATAGRTELRDLNGALLYQWGGYEPAPGTQPAAMLALAPPLGSWRLQAFAPPGMLEAGRGAMIFNLAAGFAVVALALVALAVYFYRESTRAIRDASQRVSFVNQVSHELKTPLTNIRLYAELLRERLGGGGDSDDEPEDATTARHLGIIVGECERLSRLIGNVLTFSRGRQAANHLHRAPLRMHELLAEVIAQFEPGLARRGIAVRAELEPGPMVQAAPDAIEQIVGNLLGNVEKYAASGGEVTVASRYAEGVTTIRVGDRGPGIPRAERGRIFKPFYRIHSTLTEGVSGAGIGLAIARDLARRHGGELTLCDPEDGAPGACFEARIETPPVEHEADA